MRGTRIVLRKGTRAKRSRASTLATGLAGILAGAVPLVALSQAQSSTTTVSVGAIEIAYEATGPAGGEAILLIPGTGQQLIDWPQQLIDGLTGAGFRVIRFDNRDAGLSTVHEAAGVPDLAAIEAAMQANEPAPIPYDFHDMAANAVGLLDALNVAQAHVVGASMGGAIAQLVAIDYPDRVSSLTLVGSDSGNPDLPTIAEPEAFAEMPPLPPPGEPDAHIDYRVQVSKALAGSRYPIDEAVRRDTAERSIDRFFDPEATARQETISFVGHLESADYRFDNLRRIEAPTVVLHGAEDPLVAPASANDIAERVPDAELRIVPGLGHEIPAGAADELVAAIITVADND